MSHAHAIRLDPHAADTDRPTPSHVAAKILRDPPVPSHLVQFHKDERFLLETVSRFLASGLESGERVMAITTPSHRTALTAMLERHGLDDALASGRLAFLDARGSLAKFMVGDAPDPDLFASMFAHEMGRVRDGDPRVRVRIFGEMVDLLWRDGNTRAAVRLEELWNEAARDHSFSLLCAYAMGSFYREGDAEQFMEVCRQHGHVFPAETFAQIDDTDARLREISVLQQRAQALEHEIVQRRELERALRDALRDRTRVEDELRAALERERVARAEAEKDARFKEVFVGILGHDLRNPLSTILMTARAMQMDPKPKGDEGARRVERIASSCGRMQRLIEQLLDMTRARLAGGIRIVRQPPRDLALVVARMVESTRTGSGATTMTFRAEGDTTASVDVDRFEQVVANLLGNAIAHGDRERPVTIVLDGAGESLRLSVHNFGAPIDAELLPHLFEPFAQNREAREPSAGLGLGLYVSERIIHAHGGTIAVTSSAESGTTFEVSIPKRPPPMTVKCPP